MRYFFKYFCVIFLLLSGCQEDDVFLPEINEEVVNTDEAEWRKKQNVWIYLQMKHNYLWTDQLKDSIDYDYSLEPAEFFESMLVPDDRFSYCLPYDDYKPQVKGVDLNETVSVDSVYVFPNKKVGYFVYDEFATEADVTDIVLRFKRWQIDELIVDLRNNPGGYVATCIHLASLIAPAVHLGDLFCTYRYNRFLSEACLMETGLSYTESFLKDDNLTSARNLNLPRVVFLVNNRSASCSELLIYSLRPYMEVVVIGETTVGKDVGMRKISGTRYMYELWPITFRTYNAAGDSVPVTGIVPDIYIKDVASFPVGDINERMLKVALDYLAVDSEEQ